MTDESTVPAATDGPRPSPGDETYQVTIVKYGTRQATRSEVYLNYALYHEGDGPIGMDYFFWVLRSPKRTVLVDTGFSEQGGAARRRTLLADVGKLLRAFGVEPAASPQVILTHAHYDHAGNLPLLPSSEVFMSEAEFNFWSSHHARRVLFHHSVDDDRLAYLHAVKEEGRLRLFRDSIVIAPGIEVLEVGGHTPGQCVVRVGTNEGTVLLASDAVHYYEEYDRDMLFSSVADLVAMYTGFDRIRAMIEAGDVDHLVSGHDPDTLARFRPASGEYGALAATIGTLDG